MSIHELLQEDDADGDQELEPEHEPESEPPEHAAPEPDQAPMQVAPAALEILPEGTDINKRPANTIEAAKGDGLAPSSKVEEARHAPSEPESKRPRLSTAAPPALSISRQLSQRMAPASSPRVGNVAAATPRPAAPDVDPDDRTCILCINDITRPCSLATLTQLLNSEAGIVGDAPSAIVDIWLAKLKTHAVVVFGNEEQAETVRKATHLLKWPLGSAKVLLPRYVDAAEAARIRAGEASPGAQPSPISATASGRGSFAQAAMKASQQQHALAIKALGSAAAAAAASAPEPRLLSPRGGGTEVVKEAAEKDVIDLPAASNKNRLADIEEDKVFSLNDLFRKTKSKPAIYYLPHTEQYVARLSNNPQVVAKADR